MKQIFTKNTAWQILAVSSSLALISVILWIDIQTSYWQEMVVVSGLAAGLVSFLLSSVFLHRILQHRLETRWAPITHLALTQILHTLADDKRSDLSSGVIVARKLPLPEFSEALELKFELEKLRNLVLKYREQLATTLGTWTHFLASSGDNDEIVRAVADLGWQFDQVRDATLEVENTLTSSDDKTNTDAVLQTKLQQEVLKCNTKHLNLVSALQVRLTDHLKTYLQNG